MTKVFTLLTAFTLFTYYSFSQNPNDCSNPAPTITICGNNSTAPFAKAWDRTFGSLETDYLKAICQTADGGFFSLVKRTLA